MRFERTPRLDEDLRALAPKHQQLFRACVRDFRDVCIRATACHRFDLACETWNQRTHQRSLIMGEFADFAVMLSCSARASSMSR